VRIRAALRCSTIRKAGHEETANRRSTQPDTSSALGRLKRPHRAVIVRAQAMREIEDVVLTVLRPSQREMRRRAIRVVEKSAARSRHR